MLARLGLLLAAAALLLVSATASDVLVLDPSNFDDYVGGDLPVFVEFFAPSAFIPHYYVRSCSHPTLCLPLTAWCIYLCGLRVTVGVAIARLWLPSMRSPPLHSNHCPSKLHPSMPMPTATSARSSE